ncbi:MAG: hypothetical protein IIA17_11665 [candidate division Zixibacteria bacterium]|nr:hypothetical protein [candidate division Zixibacteria bacterium]
MTTRDLKPITIAALLLVSLTLSGRAFASGSEEKSVAIYGSIGFSDPNGDLAAGAEIGFYGLTRLSLAMSPRIEVTFGIDYHAFGLDVSDDLDISQKEALSGQKFSAILFNGGLKINPGELEAEVMPFLIAGGGIALVNFSDTVTGFSYPGGTINADSDIRPYMEFGGGFEFGQIQAWLKFSNVFLQGSDARFISFGIGGKLFLI